MVVHMSAVHMEATEGVRSFEAGVTGGNETLYGCWKSNSGPLQEQPVLTAELSAPPPTCLPCSDEQFSWFA